MPNEALTLSPAGANLIKHFESCQKKGGAGSLHGISVSGQGRDHRLGHDARHQDGHGVDARAV